jgi:hypothetical protein
MSGNTSTPNRAVPATFGQRYIFAALDQTTISASSPQLHHRPT